jgi:hypothetical protein
LTNNPTYCKIGQRKLSNKFFILNKLKRSKRTTAKIEVLNPIEFCIKEELR